MSQSFKKCNDEYFVRVKLSGDVLKRFKILCINNELSIPKQMSEIVRNFVEIHEENNEKIKKIKGL